MTLPGGDDARSFDLLARDDAENHFFCQDRSVGLRAVIAIHDTTLGMEVIGRETRRQRPHRLPAARRLRRGAVLGRVGRIMETMGRVLVLARAAVVVPEVAAARLGEERIAAARAVKRIAASGTLDRADRRVRRSGSRRGDGVLERGRLARSGSGGAPNQGCRPEVAPAARPPRGHAAGLTAQPG